MNLDEFIFSDNIATPDDYSSPQGISKHIADEPRSGSSALASSAIPIKSRKDAVAQQHFVPQSVPFPPNHQRIQDEFNYVPRHTRKTSIDERRVSEVNPSHPSSTSLLGEARLQAPPPAAAVCPPSYAMLPTFRLAHPIHPIPTHPVPWMADSTGCYLLSSAYWGEMS